MSAGEGDTPVEAPLKAAGESKEAEGFTKDVSLSRAEIEKGIQEIEIATTPRKIISLEQVDG